MATKPRILLGSQTRINFKETEWLFCTFLHFPPQRVVKLDSLCEEQGFLEMYVVEKKRKKKSRAIENGWSVNVQ